MTKAAPLLLAFTVALALSSSAAAHEGHPAPTPTPGHADHPSVSCPDGYTADESGHGVLLCTRTVTHENTVTVYVDRPVDRLVEKVVQVPVEKIVTVEKPVVRTVTKTKTKTRVVTKWRTLVKTKTVTKPGDCDCPPPSLGGIWLYSGGKWHCAIKAQG